MENDKILFLNKNLNWGYTADTTKYYCGVFEPPIMDWPFEKESNWPNCSVIELTNRDIRGITNTDWVEFTEKLKEKKIKITAHDSFLRNDFYNPQSMKSDVTLTQFFGNPELSKKGNILNFFWYVVPESHKGLPAYKKSIEQGFEDIEFAYEREADRMTIHVAKPGTFLKKNEFEEYIQCWGELNDYGSNLGVDILVETGGISEEQILELKQHNAKFNLDTAHAYMDSIDVLSLYEQIKNSILETHLSMTKNGTDAHEGVNYTGDGYNPELRKINEKMAIEVNKRKMDGDNIVAILEVKPSDENVEFLYNAIVGEKNE